MKKKQEEEEEEEEEKRPVGRWRREVRSCQGDFDFLPSRIFGWLATETIPCTTEQSKMENPCLPACLLAVGRCCVRGTTV